MKALRHLLFCMVLLLTQTGALTHALEHLRTDADTSASHNCALCIAAQGLDAQLISTPSTVGPMVAAFAPPATVTARIYSPEAVSPRARAPPALL
jgi:hypothetical protein